MVYASIVQFGSDLTAERRTLPDYRLALVIFDLCLAFWRLGQKRSGDLDPSDFLLCLGREVEMVDTGVVVVRLDSRQCESLPLVSTMTIQRQHLPRIDVPLT